MPAQRKTIYLVEGEDEKKIVQMLISDFRFVRPGKVYVMNILQRKVTKARAATWGENVSVILIFDTDVMRTNIFDQNLAMLKKLSNVRETIFIPQVLNLEDELLRASKIKHIRAITKSRTDGEWKGDLIRRTNLQKRFIEIGFDIDKFWNTSPRGMYQDISNQSNKIRILSK